MRREGLEKLLVRFRRGLRDEIACAKRRKSAPGNSISFLDRELGHVASICQHLERPDIECAVVGITKAGKSTLINALLGTEALPVTNVPSTAVSIRVRHNPQLATPALREPVVEGATNVRRSLSELCDRMRAANGGKLQRPVVEACYPLAKASGLRAGATFILVDTPGVTEASGENFAEETLRCVDEADVALLVLNYANLRTTAERTFLSGFARRRPDFFLRNNARLVCTLTHFDVKDRDGAALSQVVGYLRDHVSAALPRSLSSFEHRVWAVRAQLGLLGRLAEKDALDDGQLADYMRYLYGRQGAGRRLLPARLRELGAGSLEQSRLLPLERVLREQLVDRRMETRLDAVRSRTIHALDRAAKWSESSTGNSFAPAIQEFLQEVRNGEAANRGECAS